MPYPCPQTGVVYIVIIEALLYFTEVFSRKAFSDNLLPSSLSLFPASLFFIALTDNLKLHFNFFFFTGFTPIFIFSHARI